MIVRIGAAAMTRCLVGGCTWTGGDGRDRNPDNQPRYVLDREHGDRGHADRAGPHRVRGDANATVLQLVSGADVVRVREA
jgi:hypothetical protein